MLFLTAMSSAFLKNETADAPVVIPARAPLPPGTPNYVTPRGLALLRSELAELEASHGRVQANHSEETERTRQLALLNGQIGQLNGRISRAKRIDPHAQPPHEVRFGATVTLQTSPSAGGTKSGKTAATERRFTIVGVDEADATNGLVAFTTPIARAMQGKHTGDVVRLRTAQGEHVMVITGILYA